MAFFRSANPTEQSTVIWGEGVKLRAPLMGDYPAWAELRALSREFLTPWEPTWPADDLTRGAFRRRLRRYADDQRADLAYAFLLFRSVDDVLLGGLTVANVRRGVAQAGTLGYWMGAPHAGQGYMSAALQAVLPLVASTSSRTARSPRSGAVPTAASPASRRPRASSPQRKSPSPPPATPRS